MAQGRSLHGERGLKCCEDSSIARQLPSLPSRGAWIEMQCLFGKWFLSLVAPFTGSVD